MRKLVMNNIKNITDLSVKYADSGIGIIEGTNERENVRVHVVI